MKKIKKRRRGKLSKEIVQLMEKVRRQLGLFGRSGFSVDAFQRRKRRNPQIDWCGDVLYYKQLDPFWLSTMGGEFAGRRIG
jgi:hypothetical protein